MISKRYAEKYCGEDISTIENYHLANGDMTNLWECHHRKESFYTQ